MEIKDIIKKILLEQDECEYPLELSVCCELYNAFNNNHINYDNANFYVLHNKNNHDRIIKLATVMPAPITLTNLNDTVSQIDHGVFYDVSKDSLGRANYLTEYEVLCHIPHKGFFDNCSELFAEGIVQYYPNTAYYILNPDGTGTYSKENIVFPKAAIDLVDTKDQINYTEYALSIDIPYIYDVPLLEYSKMTIENIEHLQRFRKFFGKEIANINWAKQGERTDFEYELRKGVDDLTLYYKKECFKLRKNLLTGALTTIATSLLVFSDINELFKCVTGLSGGAGLIKFISSIYDFKIEKAQMEGSDCYFLWLFGEKRV